VIFDLLQGMEDRGPEAFLTGCVSGVVAYIVVSTVHRNDWRLGDFD
jgi:hypothetical protein